MTGSTPCERAVARIVGNRRSQNSCAQVPGVQPHVRAAGLDHPAHDRLGDHVARREVGELVLALHEAGAPLLRQSVDQERALAAHRLGDQRLLAGGVRARGTSPSGGTGRTPGRAGSRRRAAPSPCRRRSRPPGSWSARTPARDRRRRPPPPGSGRRRRRRARPRRSRAASPRRRHRRRRGSRSTASACWMTSISGPARRRRSGRAGSRRRSRRRPRARSGRGGARPPGSATARRRGCGRSSCRAR